MHCVCVVVFLNGGLSARLQQAACVLTLLSLLLLSCGHFTCVDICMVLQVCNATAAVTNDTEAATALAEYLAGACFSGQNMDTSVCTCVQVGVSPAALPQ